MSNKTNFPKHVSWVLIGMICCSTLPALAQKWVEDVDGDQQPNEYRLVDPKGAVTRAACPYTCADREIPKEHCKEWKSITNSVGGECYVQDLRISTNDAMPEDTRKEAKKTTENYRH